MLTTSDRFFLAILAALVAPGDIRPYLAVTIGAAYLVALTLGAFRRKE